MNDNILNRILIEWNDSDIEDTGIVKVSDTTRNMKYRFFPETTKELISNIVTVIQETLYNTGKVSTEQNPIDLNIIDVSKITSFCTLFLQVEVLLRKEKIPSYNWGWIDISDWNVSNADNMAQMFSGCTWLYSVGDLSKWDVSNVRAMNFMFDECRHIKTLGDLSKWNVSNVGKLSAEDLYEDEPEMINTMKGMFESCTNLEYIGDISRWKIGDWVDISYMFYNCKNLTWIGDDLTNFKLKIYKSKIKLTRDIFLGSGLSGKLKSFAQD